MKSDEQYQLQPIGVVHSCFRQKFGIPRQPGLVSEARANLELLPPYDRLEALDGLETFSHLWLVFLFHGIRQKEWSPTVRPPRLGGNKRIGVFASRSMFRPNPIGLSVVELEGIDTSKGKLVLRLKGVDLLDGTPVIDIKPYIPYADAIPGARAGYAVAPPEKKFSVDLSHQARLQCEKYHERYPELEKLLCQILELDPRPAYQDDKPPRNRYAMRILDFDIEWRCEGDTILVSSIKSEAGRTEE